MAFIKYSEDEEQTLRDKLKGLDKPLYKILNPELDRMRMRHVPYSLDSPYDLSPEKESDYQVHIV